MSTLKELEQHKAELVELRKTCEWALNGIASARDNMAQLSSQAQAEFMRVVADRDERDEIIALKDVDIRELEQQVEKLSEEIDGLREELIEANDQ